MIKATDIVVGTGKTAVKGALIITEYTGYLMDGTVFDASVHRGRPFECVLVTIDEIDAQKHSPTAKSLL